MNYAALEENWDLEIKTNSPHTQAGGTSCVYEFASLVKTTLTHIDIVLSKFEDYFLHHSKKFQQLISMHIEWKQKANVRSGIQYYEDTKRPGALICRTPTPR